MHTSSQNRVIVWGFITIAVIANIAGYLWNLYQQIRWFDEVLHAFTSFALTLLLALLLYEMVLSGAQTRPILYVFTVASLGIAVGVLWEIAEWAYEQIMPGNNILGKTDTMIDLIMDILGAVVAGILSMGMLKAKQ